MREKTLIVCLEGKEMGRLLQDDHGRLQFSYDENWLQSEAAYPLSLSMPLQAEPHDHETVENFVWGLLPDSAGILDSWSRYFQTSALNAYGLIYHVGEDCAGAVQLVRSRRLKALQDPMRDDI